MPVGAVVKRLMRVMIHLMLLMNALETLVSIMAAESYNYDVNTDIAEFYFIANHTNSTLYTLKVIPGHLIYIPLEKYDDYGEEINVTTFHAIIANVHKTASLDMSKLFVNNNHIRIYGEPGATGNIYLSPVSSCGDFLSVHFTLTHCPPGYGNEICLCTVCNEFSIFILCLY